MSKKPENPRYRAAKLLARHITVEGEFVEPQFLLDPYPDALAATSSPCWLWQGAFRPKQPNAFNTNPLGLINMPRPITTINKHECHPVKPIMCLQAGVALDQEPERIFRRCKHRACVNPYHFKANVCDNTLIRRLFP